jgi:RNA polymerase sigma factor (sigma-70 family)
METANNWSELDESTLARIYNICLSHAKKKVFTDPAISHEDVVQMAFIKTAKTMNQSFNEYQWVKYLMMAINSLAIDLSRRAQAIASLELHDTHASKHSVEDEVINRMVLEPIVAKAYQSAPGQMLIAMASGWGQDEVAKTFGVAQPTLRTKVYRWRQKHLGEFLL